MELNKECYICNRIQNITEFAFRDKEKGIRQNKCRSCQSNYSKINYINNKDKYIKNNNEWKLNNKEKKYSSHKQSLYNQLKSLSKCEICGESYGPALHFHHIDPSSKKDNVSKMINSTYSLEEIDEEIDKCIVLCANCHLKLHWNLNKGYELFII